MAEADPIEEPVDALDAWENEWYPIASAVLTAHFPEARDAVFLNLVQTSGPEVIVTVGTLLDRIAEQPEEVRAILRKRGLDDDVIAEARAHLDSVVHIQAALPSVAESIVADADAEKVLWDWYLQWSAIVRAVVTDRRHLRSLGFLRMSNGELVEAPDDENDEEPDAPVNGASNGTSLV